MSNQDTLVISFGAPIVGDFSVYNNRADELGLDFTISTISRQIRVEGNYSSLRFIEEMMKADGINAHYMYK